MTIGVTRAVSLAIGAIAPTITIVHQSVSTTTTVARQIFSAIAHSITTARSLFGRITVSIWHGIANTVKNTYERLFGVSAPVDTANLVEAYKIIKYVDRAYRQLPINEKIGVLQREIDQAQALITDLQDVLRAVDERRSRNDHGASFFALAKATIQMKLIPILKAKKDLKILGRVIDYITSNEPVNHELLNQALRKQEECILYLEDTRGEIRVLESALAADIESPDLSPERLKANKAKVTRVFLEIVQVKREKLKRLEKNMDRLILAKELLTTTEGLSIWFRNLDLLGSR